MKRVAFVEGIPLLQASNEVISLSRSLLTGLNFPSHLETDALHVVISAVYGIDYLLTWNMKHIANPKLMGRIESICEESGYRSPRLCTPLALLEGDFSDQ